ncbi:MAG TPA: Maf family protein [Abditibacteriaceae bacterium]
MRESSTSPITTPDAAIHGAPFRLLLASASPRRSDILQSAGIPFSVIRSTFDEPAPTADEHAHPATYVMHLARQKAEHAVFNSIPDTQKYNRKTLILAADTIVWHNGEILGKPRDEAHAIEMLRRMRGQSHQVFTGICLRVVNEAGVNETGDEYHVTHQTTTVNFGPVSDAWIENYVATGEPMDKAGAYAAQGKGAALVEGINGDFWNVVGLPLAPLARLLETLGAPIEMWWEQGPDAGDKTAQNAAGSPHSRPVEIQC